MIRRDAFFNAIRPTFSGSLTQSQVDGMTAILDEWDRRRLTDLRHLAYALATTKHETANTMQPIAEYGHGKGHPYGKPGKDGQIAYGRGYVQLTWDYNYEKADKQLSLGGALIRDYELALRPDIAAEIMFGGMLNGWFTGKKLSDYFHESTADWVNARRIINGTDKAQTIAGYGKAFYAALQAASVTDVPRPVEPVPLPPDAPALPPVIVKQPLTTSQKGAGVGGILILLGGAIASQWHAVSSWFSHLFGG